MEKKVSIVGASGYSGEELTRLLLLHPNVELSMITSRQHAGRPLSEVFPRFSHFPGVQSLQFVAPNVNHLSAASDIVFLALPHGVAAEFAKPLFEKGTTVIDLSADFRLNDPEAYQEFYGTQHPCPELLAKAVYGSPELHRKEIQEATLIASPGCYPTSILLPIAPLLKEGLIQSTGIIADSLSGVSGAGRKVDLGYLYVECNESVRPYGIPKHRHLSEIEQELTLIAKEPVMIQFTPHLIPVNRGILTTLYLAPKATFRTQEEATALETQIKTAFEEHYADKPFVRLLAENQLPDTKNVVGTNVIEIAWRLDRRTGRLIVTSAEDNLLKGASGQAVQSMNLRFGFPETAGLI
jgi:N-acetyl-gamma-glutamyl-phosphate reductase